nr:hypothetical protein [uncultured Albidiferax sp.]
MVDVDPMREWWSDPLAGCSRVAFDIEACGNGLVRLAVTPGAH